MSQQQPVPEVLAVEIAADRAQRREERQALVAMPVTDMVGSQRMTFVPQSMGEAMQFASLMARSNFVAPHLRGNDGDCMAIVMIALRWGMDPFAVANKSYFTKEGAPPAFESQLVNAVVNNSGALIGRLKVEFEGDGEKLRCTVRGTLRADPDEERVKTQSIARITVRNSPLWKADPEQQLQYYTTRAWARAWCPEVLLGVYTPDELTPVLDVDRPPRPTRASVAVTTAVQASHSERDEEATVNSASSAQSGAGAKAEQRSEQAAEPISHIDLPQDDTEWDVWGIEVRAKADRSANADAVNALWTGEKDRLAAAPEQLREEVVAHFTDRHADLATDAGPAADAGEGDTMSAETNA